MAIIRIYTGADGRSHFEEVTPRFEPKGDRSEIAELIPGSGITIRRFEPTRSNPWHHAPGFFQLLRRTIAPRSRVRITGPVHGRQKRAALVETQNADPQLLPFRR